MAGGDGALTEQGGLAACRMQAIGWCSKMQGVRCLDNVGCGLKHGNM